MIWKLSPMLGVREGSQRKQPPLENRSVSLFHIDCLSTRTLCVARV
jgi:hypothetical protein